MAGKNNHTPDHVESEMAVDDEESSEQGDCRGITSKETKKKEEGDADSATNESGQSIVRKRNNGFRKLSRQLSKQLSRQHSSLLESLPETPAGWTVLLSLLLSSGLGYEVGLQKSLTRPPVTFGQLSNGSTMARIHEKMTATEDSILRRPIQPSLFVGTRSAISSTAAYFFGGPSDAEEHLRFREVVNCPQDGAQVAVDWEIPWTPADDGTKPAREERQGEILNGTIRQPVVIVLHGINNDASFGYMKSLQREFANRGWNAAALNFRGCGGLPMTTPRGYNGSYTGDLRSLVWTISARLADNVPIFLVGNSLGANIVTKYLGEEGCSGTLPKCVAGGVSLGNPLLIDSSAVSFPYNMAILLGVKKLLLENWSTFTKMQDPLYKGALRKGMMSATLGKFDKSVAPILIRNSAFYPYAFRVGFKDAESFWLDSSSYRLIRHISVPFLNLSAKDDFLVATQNKNKLGFCISNPNVMVVETRCGGHLGWQESPPDSDSTFGGSSWANVASADFMDAVMQTNMDLHGSRSGRQEPAVDSFSHPEMKQAVRADAVSTAETLQAKL